MKKMITNTAFKSAEDVEKALRDGFDTFADCDFSGLDLRHISLKNLVFDHGSSFNKAKLGDMSGSEFYGVSFVETDFSRADVSNCYAINCDITRVNMIGMRMTLDCYFFSGLYSTSAIDGWKLCWWAALFTTPAQNIIRSFIPSKYLKLLTKYFTLGARPARKL